MKTFLRNFLSTVFLLILSATPIFAGPVLVSPPPQGNSADNLILHRHDTSLGAVTVHANVYATAMFTLLQVNAAVDAVINSYDSITGSALSLIRGSDDPTVCSAGNIETLIAQTSGFHFYLCPQNAIDQIGLNSNVLGFTVSKTTTAGTIASVVTIVKDTLSLSFTQTVALHEVGHGLGLDHSPMSAAVMFPLTLGSNTVLHDEDLSSVYALYASNPGSPSSLYGGQGSCLTGTVSAEDTSGNLLPLNAVIIKGFDDAGNMIATTVSGIGLDALGQSNLAGDYTLCAPAGQITKAVAELCNIRTDLGPLLIACGQPQEGDAAMAAGSSSPSMLPNLIPMPYEINANAGDQFIYQASGTLPFTGDLSIGTAVPTIAGQTIPNVDFLVIATLTNFPSNQTGNFFIDDSGGCQAGHSQANFLDLSFLAFLLLPLGMIAKKYQLNPVKSARKFP